MMTTRSCTLCAIILLISAFAFADPDKLLGQPPSSVNSKSTSSSQNISSTSYLNNFLGLNLVDQNAQAFHVEKLVNQVVLFNFIFTNCGSVCPMQTKILVDVLNGLPMDVRTNIHFVSVSIDPANDTPEKLLEFSRALKADLKNWTFLTGDVEQIEKLTQRLHIFDESDSSQKKTPQIHRTSLWLVDKQGRMLQRYSGDPPDKKRLLKELIQISHLK